MAADLVATELIAEGVDGVCINIGGDLRVLGDSPSGGGWTLAIEHPLSSAPIALVGLTEGAVATSSVLKRTWKLGEQMYHHLIDPATGEPSESDLALASIVTAKGGRQRCWPRQCYFAVAPGHSISSTRRPPASLSITPV